MSTLLKLSGFLYERCPPCCYSKKWHALAYYDPQYRRNIMVIWPMHYAVRVGRWLEWQWDKYRHRKGWIDRHAEAAIKENNSLPRFYP